VTAVVTDADPGAPAVRDLVAAGVEVIR
jgi:hypothetical protein